jgi:hypothetical protein
VSQDGQCVAAAASSATGGGSSGTGSGAGGSGSSCASGYVPANGTCVPAGSH